MTVQPRRGGTAAECAAVTHAAGAATTRLTCAGLQLPATGAGPAWYEVAVEVAGAPGLRAAHAQGLLSAGAPAVTAVRAVGTAATACAQAGPHALGECPPTGAAFALDGRFRTSSDIGAPVVHVGSYQCPDVTVSAGATTLECRGLVGAGEALPIAVTLGRRAAATPGLALSFRGCVDKAGHWGGAGCAECRAGWWGAGCDRPCPGGREPCGGHGTCDSGVAGTGRCVCARGAGTGYWSGAACAACEFPYGGRGCTLRCPGTTLQSVCSGHGDCVASPGPGEGACACHADAERGHWGGPDCARCADGYSGAGCGAACPADGGRVCAGHGVCTAAGVAAQCVCEPQYAGPSCAGVCPGTCGGHGRCALRDGVAACACDPGFAGAACVECPGGAPLPCTGHGTCDPGTARCACDRSTAQGHWDGPRCDACARGWSGAHCTRECPRNASGAPCGPGTCADGQCFCPAGTCGDACGVSGAACDRFACPPGRYGADCAGACPTDDTGAVCAGHGSCLARTYGTGACVCDPGYAGAVCGGACARTALGVCAGHGVCASPGGCACFRGYAAADCSAACPAEGGSLCAGHGTCNDGPSGSGACACDPGYTGAGCGALCPGFDPQTGTGACGGHGTCAAPNLTCTCHGHWAGEACQICVAGWFGEQCSRQCSQRGVTVGKVCCRLNGAGLRAVACGGLWFVGGGGGDCVRGQCHEDNFPQCRNVACVIFRRNLGYFLLLCLCSWWGLVADLCGCSFFFVLSDELVLFKI